MALHLLLYRDNIAAVYGLFMAFLWPFYGLSLALLASKDVDTSNFIHSKRAKSQYVLQLRNFHQGNLGSFFSAFWAESE